MAESSYTLIRDLTRRSGLEPDSIVSRTLHNGDHVKVTLFYFAEGQALTEHTSSRPAILQILKGQAVLGLGHDMVNAGEGTWVHMPAGLAHSVTAETAMTMLLTLLKT